MTYSPPNFALQIEHSYPNLNNLKDKLADDLKKYIGCCDCVVLGCTHYVFCKKMIEDILKVPAYDGNAGIARRLHELLDLFKLHTKGGKIRFVNEGAMFRRLVGAYALIERWI